MREAIKGIKEKSGGGIAEEGMTADEFYRYSEGKGQSRHLAAIAGALRNTGGGAALDIGCGAGFTLEQLSQKAGGALFCGCDTERELLEMAAERGGGMSWVCNGPEALPFADAAFDFVYSEGALHHFVNPMRMFEEMWRVLKPGGRLLVIDLNPRSRLARLAYTFISIKKLLGLAGKGELALMMSIKNSLPMETGLSMLEGVGAEVMVSRSLASIYYEARKPKAKNSKG